MDDRVKEIIQRMAKGEAGLHTKIVGSLKIIRLNSLPVLLKQNVQRDIDRKFYEVLKSFTYKKTRILILERSIKCG